MLQQLKDTPLKDSSGIFQPVVVMFPIIDTLGHLESLNDRGGDLFLGPVTV